MLFAYRNQSWIALGIILSPLMFIIFLEALSLEFCVGCPQEIPYADELVILAETFEGLMIKLTVLKMVKSQRDLRRIYENQDL